MSRVLTFSDLHAPFMKRGFISWLLELSERFQPDQIVICGDLVDNHALGRWPKHPDAENVGREVSLAKEQLAELYYAFPGDVKLILGNHDDRLKKRLYDLGIPESLSTGYKELYGIPDSWTIHPDACEIDGVYYYHGHKKGGANPAMAMAKLLGKSVVCGHYHGIGGISRHTPNGAPLWGMNLGCGVDISSYGMYYAKETLMQPVLGAGTVVDGKYAHYYIMGE